MGRNAAFGRPPASERFRSWWNARSRTSRQNTYLALGVSALFVAIVTAATARDQTPTTGRVIASRPQPTTTVALPAPSTVDVGDLGGTTASVTAADLVGLSTTTTAAPAPAPATTVASVARPAPAVATTAPLTATTVTNPDVIFSTVPSPTTTSTQPPVTTTRPPTTTTTAPATTTTLLSVPLSLPALLAPH